MTKTRTATIERCHCYGTPRYYLCLTYNGRIVRWWENGSHVFAQSQDDSAESFDAMKNHARKQGFTHIKVVGVWDRRTKPNGGKL